MRRVCVLQCAHLASQRVPNKLLLEIGGQSLLHRGLARLRKVQGHTGAPPIMIAWPGDAALMDAADHYGVEVLPISEEASQGNTAEVVYAGLTAKLQGRFDWCFVANFLCRPFLHWTTAATVVRQARRSETAFVTTTLQRGLVWDALGNAVIGAGQTADTKFNPGYHVLAHLGYGLPVNLLERPERELAAAARPYSVPMRWEERIDIDTPEDAEFAARIARTITEEVIS